MNIKVRENMNGFSIIAQADSTLMGRPCVVIMGKRVRPFIAQPGQAQRAEYVVARVCEDNAAEWDNGRYGMDEADAWRMFLNITNEEVARHLRSRGL